VVTPYGRAGYVHEFLDESDALDGSLAALSGADFRLSPPKEDEDYARFGAGVAATFGQGFSQFVDYDVIALHRNVTVHQVTVGLRLEL
jgi:outer membrane autotransporter protein